MASGVHRSERAEDRQVVEAASAHATQASWRSPVCDPAEERMRRRIAKLTWLRLGSHHPLQMTPKRSTQTAVGGTSNIDGKGGED